MRLNGYIGTIGDKSDDLFCDGSTDYQVLIPEKATEAERFAARELADIFYRAGVVVETCTDEGLSAEPTAKFIALGNTVYFQALGTKPTQKEFKFDGFIEDEVQVDRQGKNREFHI